MPLTEAVSFKTRLQRGNRLQVPKPIRWQFKLKTSHVLRVVIHPLGMHLDYEEFYSKIDKSGRITVPKLTLKLLENETQNKQSLTGTIIEVTIEPA